MQPGVRVDHPRVRVEQHVVDPDLIRAVLVRKVRVRVYPERRPGGRQKPQELRHYGGHFRAEPARRGRVGFLENREVVGGGDLDGAVEAEAGEGGVDADHGRDELGQEGSALARVNLVPNGDLSDFRRREVRFNAGLDPLEGLVRVG